MEEKCTLANSVQKEPAKSALPEPPLPENCSNPAVRMYLAEGKLVAELNLAALAELRYDIWWLATKGSFKENTSIWSSQLSLPPEATGVLIGYCEITLSGEGPIGSRLHNPNAELLHRDDRVDLFVNRAQAERAYQDLESLSGNEIGQSVTLFGKLTIKVVETKGEQTHA